MPARPLGRSLADFGTLSDAEQKLLKASRHGDDCVIAAERPGANGNTAVNTVRAEFLRFLILGGDDENPIHEKGISIKGAWIDGELDLEGVASSSDVWAFSCWFDQTLVLRNARIKGNLGLPGSRIPGLQGDQLTCDASLFCCYKFLSEGEFRVAGATIGGDLNFRGGTLGRLLENGNPAGNALIADKVNVKGTVFLDEDFIANGLVRLLGAAIGGNLDCKGATFHGPLIDKMPAGDTLIADRISVKGSLFFTDGFTANGEVGLLGAFIGGNLTCIGATFKAGVKCAINAERVSVSGIFFFRDLPTPADKVSLGFARVQVLADDAAAWGGNLDLDGFTYEKIGGSSPKDAKMRLEWLDKQRPEWSGKNGKPDEFRPQPWLQLREVLRKGGNADDARKVGIALEDRRRLCGQITGVAKAFHWIYGFSAGYGYQPLYVFRLLFVIWLACSFIYSHAAARDKFIPADSSVYGDPNCKSQAPIKGGPPVNPVFTPPCDGDYPVFSPLIYSLNVILPVVDLGQERAWAPRAKPHSSTWWRNFTQPFTDFGSFIQLVVWVETLAGYVAGLYLGSVITGLLTRPDDS